MDSEHYRGDLTAARVRIAQLEAELEAYRADPSFERVEIAEERLERARARRRRLERVLPRLLIGSFVSMGAFALTDPTLPAPLRALGYVVFAAGAVMVVTTMAALLFVSSQGLRPARIVELERQVRLARGDVGKRLRLASDDGRHEESEEAAELRDRALAR